MTTRAFSEALALASPSGRMSKRALKAAQERIRIELFGVNGLQRELPAQPSKREAMLRQASELRALAERGFQPRKHIKAAIALEILATSTEDQ